MSSTITHLPPCPLKRPPSCGVTKLTPNSGRRPTPQSTPISSGPSLDLDESVQMKVRLCDGGGVGFEHHRPTLDPTDIDETIEPMLGIAGPHPTAPTPVVSTPMLAINNNGQPEQGSAAALMRRTPSQIRKATRVRLNSKKVLGHGTWGTVFVGLNEATRELIAIKEVTFCCKEEIDALAREIRVMKNLDHPNIVHYLGAEREENTLKIYMEYIDGGSLAGLIRNFGVLSELMAQGYCVQILRGLAYLHSKNIAHRDIKCDNLLVEKNGDIKLSDFGQAKVASELLKTVTGTAYFMAPEVIRGEGYSLLADIWSFGCAVIEMLTGQPPYAQYGNQYAVMYRITHDDPAEQIPSTGSARVRDFLACCLKPCPTERWPAERLLSHRFLLEEEEQRLSTPEAFSEPVSDAETIDTEHDRRAPFNQKAPLPVQPFGLQPSTLQPSALNNVPFPPAMLELGANPDTIRSEIQAETQYSTTFNSSSSGSDPQTIRSECDLYDGADPHFQLQRQPLSLDPSPVPTATPDFSPCPSPFLPLDPLAPISSREQTTSSTLYGSRTSSCVSEYDDETTENVFDREDQEEEKPLEITLASSSSSATTPSSSSKVGFGQPGNGVENPTEDSMAFATGPVLSSEEASSPVVNPNDVIFCGMNADGKQMNLLEKMLQAVIRPIKSTAEAQPRSDRYAPVSDRVPCTSPDPLLPPVCSPPSSQKLPSTIDSTSNDSLGGIADVPKPVLLRKPPLAKRLAVARLDEACLAMTPASSSGGGVGRKGKERVTDSPVKRPSPLSGQRSPLSPSPTKKQVNGNCGDGSNLKRNGKGKSHARGQNLNLRSASPDSAKCQSPPSAEASSRQTLSSLPPLPVIISRQPPPKAANPNTIQQSSSVTRTQQQPHPQKQHSRIGLRRDSPSSLSSSSSFHIHISARMLRSAGKDRYLGYDDSEENTVRSLQQQQQTSQRGSPLSGRSNKQLHHTSSSSDSLASCGSHRQLPHFFPYHSPRPERNQSTNPNLTAASSPPSTSKSRTGSAATPTVTSPVSSSRPTQPQISQNGELSPQQLRTPTKTSSRLRSRMADLQNGRSPMPVSSQSEVSIAGPSSSSSSNSSSLPRVLSGVLPALRPQKRYAKGDSDPLNSSASSLASSTHSAVSRGTNGSVSGTDLKRAKAKKLKKRSPQPEPVSAMRRSSSSIASPAVRSPVSNGKWGSQTLPSSRGSCNGVRRVSSAGENLPKSLFAPGALFSMAVVN